jgi:hypothetical protein
MFTATRVAGTPTLDLWVGTKSFDDNEGELAIGIYDCNFVGANCALLSSVVEHFDQVPFGATFGRLVVSLPPVDATVARNRSLVLKVAATNESDDDLWLAYGTTTYPSVLSVA